MPEPLVDRTICCYTIIGGREKGIADSAKPGDMLASATIECRLGRNNTNLQLVVTMSMAIENCAFLAIENCAFLAIETAHLHEGPVAGCRDLGRGR